MIANKTAVAKTKITVNSVTLFGAEIHSRAKYRNIFPLLTTSCVSRK
jgi:hypothetical protein